MPGNSQLGIWQGGVTKKMEEAGKMPRSLDHAGDCTVAPPD